jgi:hypothetical protein
MKKSTHVIGVLFFSLFLMFGFSNSAMAYIDGWELDLSGVLGGLGTYSNIDRIDVNGGSSVNQSFGANGVFDDGDAFTEFAQLNQVIYFEEPGNAGNLKTFAAVAAAGYNIYIYAAGLTGKAFNVSVPDPSDPSTWEFEYSFDPHVGTIGMYIDNDLNPLNGTSATLSEFDLTDGGGIGNPGFLGGATPNGTTNITSVFDNTLSGVFFDGNGNDISSFPAGYALGLLNTNNQVVANTFAIYAGGTPTGFAGFTVDINNAGQMNIDVVPEPATIMLLGIGLVGLAAFGKKKIRK